MSTPTPSPVPLNLEQQRKRAKELLADARAGNTEALARLAAVRAPNTGESPRLTLADAQHAIAREVGHASWPKLVAAVEAEDVAAFATAVRAGDVSRVERLLALDYVRAAIDAPSFDFGQRAAHVAANQGNEALLAVLIDAGADVNLRSDWQNGPYTVLDGASEQTARYLLSRGATLTPNVAARLGWEDRLREMLDADPSRVHERGGDGQQPLHQASSIAIADLLLERGADIDARCIDHNSTPAQYALVDRADVCRHLIERGATADIFMPARLGDVTLAERLLDADPASVDARIHREGYALVPPFNIYCWTLGFGMSPHAVALKYEHRDVVAVLEARSPIRVRLFNAVLAGDEAAARALLDEQPTLVASFGPDEHGHLAHAIFHERYDAAALMLRLGFDPAAPGVDGGSALHAACWVGNVAMVAQILARGGVSVDAPDPTHKSPPLGWAAFGSVQRRANGADYGGVIDRLVAAGADIHATGNRHGRSLVQMADGNPPVQAVLRRHGAG